MNTLIRPSQRVLLKTIRDLVRGRPYAETWDLEEWLHNYPEKDHDYKAFLRRKRRVRVLMISSLSVGLLGAVITVFSGRLRGLGVQELIVKGSVKSLFAISAALLLADFLVKPWEELRYRWHRLLFPESKIERSLISQVEGYESRPH